MGRRQHLRNETKLCSPETTGKEITSTFTNTIQQQQQQQQQQQHGRHQSKCLGTIPTTNPYMVRSLLEQERTPFQMGGNELHLHGTMAAMLTPRLEPQISPTIWLVPDGRTPHPLLLPILQVQLQPLRMVERAYRRRYLQLPRCQQLRV